MYLQRKFMFFLFFKWKLILIQSQTTKNELRNIYVTNVVYQFVSKVDFATTYYLLGNRYNVTYKRFLCPVLAVSLDCPFLVALSNSCFNPGVLWVALIIHESILFFRFLFVLHNYCDFDSFLFLVFQFELT
jgi:hypothetical protein